MPNVLATPDHGFEVSVITGNVAPNNFAQTIQVRGWLWWVVCNVMWQINNGTGLATARPLLTLIWGNVSVGIIGAANTVAAGSSLTVNYGLQAGAGVAATGPIPESIGYLPMIGDGTIQMGFTGGDGNTLMEGGVVVMMGRRRNPTGKA